MDLICRVCLREKPNLADIFDPRINYSGILMGCSSIKVSPEDGLPSHICPACAKLASNAVAFRSLCERSDRKLKSFTSGHLTSFVSDIKQEVDIIDVDLYKNCDLTKSLYDCVWCNHKCYSPQELVCHAVDFHSSDRKNQCTLCNRLYSSEFDLKKHQVTHVEFTVEGQQNVCPICRQKFTKHNLLLNHMGYHLENSPYSCECGSFFTTEFHLKMHKKKRHRSNEKTQINRDFSIISEYVHVEVKIEPEHEIKDAVEKSEQNLPNFIIQNKTPLKTENKTLFNSSSEPENYFNAENSEFSGDEQEQNRYLKKRKKDLRNSKAKNKRLKRKTEISNNGIPNIPTIENSSTDTQKIDDRIYLCAICGKGYAKKSHLIRHIHTHSKEKIVKPPLVCPICGQAINNSNRLVVHMRMHKDKNGQPLVPEKESPDKKVSAILCTLCGKSYSCRSNLAIHMRRHLGVMTCMCKICGKGYPRKADLTVHMRQHTGERPYVCSFCTKGFARSSHLAIHVRTHTGEKPYSCKMCNRAFAQSNDLASHKKRNNCGLNEPKASASSFSTIKPTMNVFSKSLMKTGNHFAKNQDRGSLNVDIEKHLAGSLLVVTSNDQN